MNTLCDWFIDVHLILERQQPAASRRDPHNVSLRSRRPGRRRRARRALAAVVELAECSNRGGGAVVAPAASGEPIVWGRAPTGAGSVMLGMGERDWRLP